MTSNEARLMRFALRYPEGWHSYGQDAARTVRRLAGHGLLELSGISKQFRLTRPAIEKVDVYKVPASETGTRVTP